MNLIFGLREGLREIWAHKFRSFLTMLGVILGVASLMAMFALTAGMAKGFRSTLEQVGGIEKVDINDAPVPPEQEARAERSPGRTYLDVIALRKGLRDAAAISPQIRLDNAKVSFGNKSARPIVSGVLQDNLVVDRHVVRYGRFISDLDLERSHRVCVLGAAVVGDLFGDPEAIPLGEYVRINGELFKVVGIFDNYLEDWEKKAKETGIAQQQEERRKTRGGTPKPSKRWSMFWWKKNFVAIPITTMQQVFKSSRMENNVDTGRDTRLSNLAVTIKDPSQLESSLQQMRNILSLTHRGIRDFGFETKEDWLDNIETSTRAAKLSGGLIAGISLLVGGLGIANIMLASISERIREIGIRRAVGATAFDIFIQIVIEATSLAILGGILGVAAGFALVQVLVLLAPAQNNPIIEPTAILISLGFAFLVGVLAGLYPAFKAAQLSPIQALRYE